MRRLLTLVGTLMLAVMIWTGAAAHAAEAMGCVEVNAEAPGHFEGDRDQVPGDPNKGGRHHHGGCHGHHVGVAAGAEPAEAAPADSRSLGVRLENFTAGCDPGTVLRPPIA